MRDQAVHNSGNNQRPCLPRPRPCYEFVPLWHAIGSVLFLLSGCAIIGFVDGRRKLIALPCLLVGGCLLLSGHQFHCRDGNDYNEDEYCHLVQHDGKNVPHWATAGAAMNSTPQSTQKKRLELTDRNRSRPPLRRLPLLMTIRHIFAYTQPMSFGFPILERKQFVVTCKRCRRDVPASVREFPFQPIVVPCPLCGELRRYLPSEVFLGQPNSLVSKQARRREI